MKNFYYILSIMFIAAIVLSAMNMDFAGNLFSESNFYQWLVICAGICGILLSLFLARFQALKNLLDEKDRRYLKKEEK